MQDGARQQPGGWDLLRATFGDRLLVLGEADAASVLAGIDETEARLGPDTHERYHALARRVIEAGGIEDLSFGMPRETLAAMLNALPVELSFVDADDRVRYFSHENREKIFGRTRGVIGTEVRNCHPPKSVHMVEAILADFKAGRVTLAAALLGEALILAAFVMLVAGASGQGLLIRDLVSSLAASPYRDPVILLVIVGFGLKIGLVPLHGWMPLSYGAGPLVATAVLSGATSKAGLMGLIRFLPLDAPHPHWGGVLLAAGLLPLLVLRPQFIIFLALFHI